MKKLFESLDKLIAIGLDVKLVICDLGSNNRSLFETVLGTSPRKPYFVTSQSKIFVWYDPPHLLKNINNNLKKHGLSVDGAPVLWKYIQEFYEKDASLPIRMAPKLTSKHIDLSPFAPLRVNLATQVLSHSVAAGICTHCSLGTMQLEALATAGFVEKNGHALQLFQLQQFF